MFCNSISDCLLNEKQYTVVKYGCSLWTHSTLCCVYKENCVYMLEIVKKIVKYNFKNLGDVVGMYGRVLKCRWLILISRTCMSKDYPSLKD